MSARVDGALRRALDVLIAAGALVACAPLFVAIALVVRASSRGPVFFVQQRVGRDGQLFGLFKFRTMVTDAVVRGPALTVGADARITRVGGVLRRYKLDELPQFLNVLRGEMGIVGPRPEVPGYVTVYTPEQRRVLSVRPGITDPASLVYHDEAAVLAACADPETAYVEQVLPEKLRLSLDYLDRRTVWSDLSVILRTAWRMVGGPGRVAIRSREAGNSSPSLS